MNPYNFFLNFIFLDEPPILLQDCTDDDSTINHLLDPKRIHNLIENVIINSNQISVNIIYIINNNIFNK